MSLNFHWVWNRELAGCALPGLFRPIAEDLADLRGRGVRSVVTLTEQRLPADLENFGLAELHFPIEDMGIPLLAKARETCRLIPSAEFVGIASSQGAPEPHELDRGLVPNTDFTSRNSSKPNAPHSRPSPDCL